ncbi:MAG TPA: hypothetical protein VGY48_15125 [Vicinamibacterales bacterium]|jgi:hypothetical protein|nr:hypothetical protein [Vicinamibacterales bacterium]
MALGRHRFRGFGSGLSDPSVAGPLIGGGATQVGVMLAHLHAKKNPKALRHAGLHGLVLGGLVGGALAMSSKHRATGISALVTVGIITVPRIIEGFMGLGHRHEEQLQGFGTIVPQALQGFGEPEVQLLDSGSGGGVLGTHVAEELHGMGNAEGVEIMGAAGFGSNFLQSQ